MKNLEPVRLDAGRTPKTMSLEYRILRRTRRTRRCSVPKVFLPRKFVLKILHS